MTELYTSVITFRKNYEFQQFKLCLLGIVGSVAFLIAIPESAVIGRFTISILTVIAAVKLPAVCRRWKFDLRFIGSRRQWLTFRDAISLAQKSKENNTLWLGKGFDWHHCHCQQGHYILNSPWQDQFQAIFRQVYPIRYFLNDPAKILLHPFQSLHHYRANSKSPIVSVGDSWIHALDNELDLTEKVASFAGHTLLVGTTGAGKTRALELLMLQAILRGDPVILLDPKGDDGLERSAKRLCDLCGRTKAFKRFHLAYPEHSIHLDLLANYSEPAEIADRIANTIEGSGQDKTFIDMGRSVMRVICNSQHLCGEKITFSSLLHYFDARDELAEKTLKSYLKKVLDPNDFSSIYPAGTSLANRLESLKKFYRQRADQLQQSIIDSVIALADRNADDLRQVTQTTIGQLEKFTSGQLERLLSPNSEDSFLDLRTLIQKKCVLYVGLTAMRDESIAHAVGSALLSDLTSVASSIYAYDHTDLNDRNPIAGNSKKTIWVFADEASDLICAPFIALLNKGRGAGLNLILATQTFADFASRLGSTEDATRVIANVNNILALRCNDAATQEFVTSRLAEVEVNSHANAFSLTTEAQSPLIQRGSYSTKEQKIRVKLIPASMLSALPTCEFFAVLAAGRILKGRIPILVTSREEFRT